MLPAMSTLVDRLLPEALWQRIQLLLAPLDEWAKAGVFEQLQAVLLDELGEAGCIDVERVSVDSFILRAIKGGTDRRKPSRSRQGRVQAAPDRRRRWLPLVLIVSQRRHHVRGGAGRHPGDPDARRLQVPPANQGPRRQGLRSSPLPGVSAPAGHPTPDRPPQEDRADGAWLGGWRRLRIRYERSSERFYALAMLACSVICFKALQPPW
jgi:hypothetical protein